MANVSGNILLPQNISREKSRRVLIEVRDTSVADAPSTVVAQQSLKNVALAPSLSIPYSLEVPAGQSQRHLSLRVHVDLDGTGVVTPGDLLTVQAYPIKQGEEPGPLDVHVVAV